MPTVDTGDSANIVLQLSAQLAHVNKRLESVLSIHGISFTEFLVILNLSKVANHSLRRVELAESVGLTASGITRVVAPMEKIGLVTKETNARDARVSLVKLTKAGHTLLKDAAVTVNQVSETILQPLTDGQRKKLVNLLGSLN